MWKRRGVKLCSPANMGKLNLREHCEDVFSRTPLKGEGEMIFTEGPLFLLSRMITLRMVFMDDRVRGYRLTVLVSYGVM